MIVPAGHAEFLKLPLSFWLATASHDNTPEPIKCTGVKFESSTETFTCFAPKKFFVNGFKHLEENPVLALVGVELHTYEGYQYKGPYLAQRDCTVDEIAFQYKYMKEFTDVLQTFGYLGQGFFDAYVHAPFVAIEFTVAQVFDQSPKVGTGGEIGKIA